MPRRTLERDEFEEIERAVFEALPAGLSKEEFDRAFEPRFEAAIAEAEYKPAPVKGSAVGRFLEPFNPVEMAKGAAALFAPEPGEAPAYANPLAPVARAARRLAGGTLAAHQEAFEKAKAAAREGRPVEAVARGVTAVVPLVGPAIGRAGEMIGEGDVAGGMGQAAAVMSPIGVRAAAPVVGRSTAAVGRAVRRPIQVTSRLNPEEASAVRLALEEGVPLDLATATGSPTARAMQKRVAHSIGGEGTAERAIAAQEGALERVLRESAERVSPGKAQTAETAGREAAEGVRATASSMSEMAGESYAKLRQFEESPAHVTRVVTAPKGSPTYRRMKERFEEGIGHPVSERDLYGLRQIEAELTSQPYTKRRFREPDTGGGLEYVPGTGGAGAKVYHDVLDRLDGAEMTRGEMESALRQALESGRPNAVSKAALAVVKERQKRGLVTGPRLAEDAPLLGQTADIGLAVDISTAKKALEPLYDHLREVSQIAPLMGSRQTAYLALRRLMEGPEVAPLSAVDEALSGLKGFVYGKGPTAAATDPGRGQAALAVRALDKQVQERAARAGSDVAAALSEGRSATRGKYEAFEVFEALEGEPVRAFQKLTAPKDTNIELLRRMRDTSPMAVPAVGRAYLERLLGKATAEGGFQRAAGLMADWQQLGAETKNVLFGSEMTRKLDRFFLLAKRIGENPNPSGTAHTLTATDLLSTIWTWPLAKILYTPKGVSALTRGLTTVAKPKASRAELRAAQAGMLAAAREAGVEIEADEKGR